MSVCVCVCVCVCVWTECKHQAASGQAERCVWANQTLVSAPLHSIATHSPVLTPYVCVIVCSFAKNVTTILSKMIPSRSKLNQHAILHVINVLICMHGCASFTCV